MNIVLVYDSIFGNTRAIAEAARDVLAAGHEVRLAAVQEADQLDLTRTDLLIVGSPTRGFRPTPHISSYVGSLDRVAPRQAGGGVRYKARSRRGEAGASQMGD